MSDFILQPIIKLTRDAAAILTMSQPDPISGEPPREMSSHEARALVDLYYTMQELRKRIANQILAIERGADVQPKHESADFLLSQAAVMEENAKLFLNVFVNSHPMAPWFNAVHGIGPVLAAGLLAHLGSRRVPPTVGHWWRFAGLDPSQKWLKSDELAKLWNEQTGDIEERTRVICKIVGRNPASVIRDATTNFRTGETTKLTKAKALKSLARIPFNRPLKTLCWKIADQMVKLGDRKDAHYAAYYRDRKAIEIARNQAGDRAEQAAKVLAAKPKHAQRAKYENGMLPDGHVDAMARRATVKLFLSHLHELWHEVDWGTPPTTKPFAISMQGHAHYIAPFYAEFISKTTRAA